jgi:hypothetical protein
MGRRDEMRCPHCKKDFEAPDGLYLNAECYGGGQYHVMSICCGKPVKVRTSVRVIVDVLGKGIETETEPWR